MITLIALCAGIIMTVGTALIIVLMVKAISKELKK